MRGVGKWRPEHDAVARECSAIGENSLVLPDRSGHETGHEHRPRVLLLLAQDCGKPVACAVAVVAVAVVAVMRVCGGSGCGDACAVAVVAVMCVRSPLVACQHQWCTVTPDHVQVIITPHRPQLAIIPHPTGHHTIHNWPSYHTQLATIPSTTGHRSHHATHPSRSKG